MATTKNRTKTKQKTVGKNRLPLIIAAVAAAAALAAVLLPGRSAQVVKPGEYLSIPMAEVGQEAGFYPVKVDGVDMEVIAIRDSGGAVRTAFNTCQSCYRSGQGYYEADGEELICQNCGFHFTADQVQVESGGCNPYPIFPESKTETDDEILISYDFLKASSGIFANWK